MHDYSSYLPSPVGPPAWGAVVTAAGRARIPPGSEYPLRSHPANYLFRWPQRRTLDAWQVILVEEGSGVFESAATGRRVLGDGSVFLLFPGVWHRYRPTAATGWVENWIEFQGPLPDQLRARRILHPRRAIHHLGPQPDLVEALNRCHLLIQERPAGHGAQLATTAMHILALILALAESIRHPPRRINQVIRKAQTLLTERCDQRLIIHQLARELGIGYSHFRRNFRRQTGLSPKQYLAALRLRRAQALLRDTALTIKEISERLSYASPYHLSVDFKRRTGRSPTSWRGRKRSPFRAPAQP